MVGMDSGGEADPWLQGCVTIDEPLDLSGPVSYLENGEKSSPSFQDEAVGYA